MAFVALLLIQVGSSYAQRRFEPLPPPPEFRQPTVGFSLSELEDLAESRSPNLQRTAAEIQVQRGRAWQAGLYRNPEVQGGSPQWGGRDSQYYTMLSQEIVTAGKLKLDRAAINREVEIAELQFLRSRYELLTQVRQSFYIALAAQQRLDAFDGLLRVVRRSTAASLTLEKSGEVARGDTLLLELEQERAEFGRENAAAALEAAHRQLTATIAAPDTILDRLQGDLAAGLPDYPYQLTQSGVLTRNSQVQAADVEIQRNQFLLKRATVEPVPNVTVAGGYMYQVTEPHNMAMLQLSIPIPVWNKNQGQIHAAQASINRATHAAEQTRLDLTKQLAAATGRFEIARQQTARYERAILPKAKESVRLTQQAFDSGQFDLLRVLQSQRILVESELSYITAQESRWTAAAEIAGLLQEEEFPRAER